MYVGKTTEFDTRMYDYSIGHGHSGWLSNSIAKHGWENFAVKIVEEIPVDQLDEAERFWIDFLNTLAPNGYNLTEGGQGGRQADGVLARMSEAAIEANRRRIEDGTHHFIVDNPSPKRIADGTHNWLDDDHAQRCADEQNRRIADGTHHFLTDHPMRKPEAKIKQGRTRRKNLGIIDWIDQLDDGESDD